MNWSIAPWVQWYRHIRVSSRLVGWRFVSRWLNFTRRITNVRDDSEECFWKKYLKKKWHCFIYIVYNDDNKNIYLFIYLFIPRLGMVSLRKRMVSVLHVCLTENWETRAISYRNIGGFESLLQYKLLPAIFNIHTSALLFFIKALVYWVWHFYLTFAFCFLASALGKFMFCAKR